MSSTQGTALGHRSIAATHRKTLEILREAEIGPSATCVVAVAAEIDERRIAKLRGEVELRIAVGGRKDAVRGRLNPAFRPGDLLVVRRADAITRDALLIDADRGASDLDRDLVAALADPHANVELEFREVRPKPGDAARLRTAGALLVDLGPLWQSGPAPVEEADIEIGSPLDAERIAAARRTLEAGGRVLARLDPHLDPQAPPFVRAAADAGHAVLPAAGLPPIAASLAVAGVPLDRISFEDGSQRRPRRLHPGCCRVATGVRGDRVESRLADAEIGLVTLDPRTPREQHLPWRAGEQLHIPGGRTRRAIVVAFSPGAEDSSTPPAAHQASAHPASAGAATGAPSHADRPTLDPVAASLASAMLAKGDSTREVALAVQQATGLSRRAAYDAVLSLRRLPVTSSVERPEPRTSR